MQKKYLSIKRILFFSILFSFMLITLVYYRHYQSQQAIAEEHKLDLQRKESGERLRNNGRKLAEQMRLHPLKLRDDPFAEPEPTDAVELAQAKLWHQTPPAQRGKLFSDKPMH